MIVRSQHDLCLSCHGPLRAALEKGASVHAPARNGECTKCHSPHKARIAKLMLAQSPDLCVTCHKDLKARLEKEKAHQPATGDCTACHRPHEAKQASLLQEPVLELCGQCHDVSAASFGTAHIGIKASVMDCRSCHDPHASKDPKFFKDNQHPPFAARSCGDCHVVGK